MKKENLKIYAKMAIILASIAGVCGLLIGAVNEVTSPVIEQNKINKEQNALKQVVPNGEFKKRELLKDYEYINAIYDVVNIDTITKVYTLSGKNAYGQIDLMAGIEFGNKIFKVVTMTNTESYGSTVDEFIENNFKNPVTSLDGIDVKCGATYGAKLVRDMLKEAVQAFEMGD